MDKQELEVILESNFSRIEDMYIASDWDEEAYIANNIEGIRNAKCEPFILAAKVAEPGFPEKELGDIIEGYCVAHEDGYWLVYEPTEKRFYCFWGNDREQVAARGVYGNALYCWTA